MRSYQWTPEQVAELTLPQIELALMGPKKDSVAAVSTRQAMAISSQARQRRQKVIDAAWQRVARERKADQQE